MAEAKNYPSNSKKPSDPEAKAEAETSKEERVSLQPIVVGKATERKPSLGKRIAETFTNDSAQNVGHYVFFDVIMPAVKATISDAVSQGIERMLFGDSRRSGSGRTNYTNYSKSSSTRVYPGKPTDPRDSEGRRVISGAARASHNFREVVIADRGDAEAVLDALIDQIDQYGIATVSDLYDLVGISGSFQDVKWGWNTLRGASIGRDRDGWLLDLPRPIEL